MRRGRRLGSLPPNGLELRELELPDDVDGAGMMFVSAGTVHRKARQDKMENGLGHRRTVTPVSKLGQGVPRPWVHNLRPTAIGYGPERQEADMDSSLHGFDSRLPVLGQGLETLGLSRQLSNSDACCVKRTRSTNRPSPC
jgi:hypothetical protein